MTQPSNLSTTRRITPADEAYLRRIRAGMKFTYAGPFARLLDPIRPVKPWRDLTGKIGAQPRYAATSAESWTIASRLDPFMVETLERKFGREYGSVLDPVDESGYPGVEGIEAIVKERPKRRRRGGRKVAP